jgi:hypothetical protein
MMFALYSPTAERVGDGRAKKTHRPWSSCDDQGRFRFHGEGVQDVQRTKMLAVCRFPIRLAGFGLAS